MPIMTQIKARFWGEGADQIHEWAKDGDVMSSRDRTKVVQKSGINQRFGRR